MKSRKRTHIVRPFKVNLRDSAYQIEFAVQIPKIRGHVPRSAAEKPRKDGVRIFDLQREKVSTIGRNFCPAGICPSRRLGTSPSIESVVSIEIRSAPHKTAHR